MADRSFGPVTRRRFLATLAGVALGALAGCVPRAKQELPTATVPPATTRAPTNATSAVTATLPPSPTPAPPTATPPRPTPTAAGASAVQPTAAGRGTRPVVAVARCKDYGTAQVEAVVRGLVVQCGGLRGIVRPGCTVVIKPNFTAGGRAPTVDCLPNVLTYTTHPDVTRAVALLAKEAGAGRVILVEGWGADVWQVNRHEALVRELDLETLDLDDPAPAADFATVPVPGAMELAEIYLHEAIAEADVLISVPKMKCHASCGITLAIKNIFGCTPLPRYRESQRDGSRTTMHKGLWGERLPRILVDILAARPINFAVVDAISTQDQGEGPWNSSEPGIQVRTVRPHLLLAGRNPVAVDAVGTALMGFDPAAAHYATPFYRSLNHIALAAERGLGPNRLEEIEVRGPAIDEARFQFTPCPRLSADLMRHVYAAIAEPDLPGLG